MEATELAQDVDQDGIINKDDRLPNYNGSILTIIVGMSFWLAVFFIIFTVKSEVSKRWKRRKNG